MKKSLSVALILLAVVNIIAICATTISFAGDINRVAPNAPENFAVANSATGVRITWSSVKNSAGYKIYRCENETEYKEIAVVKGVAEKSYTDTTVKSGTEYKYTVKAYNSFGNGKTSKELSVIYLKQPTLTKANCVYGGIELVWKKSAGAGGYTVYRKNGKDNKVIAKITGAGTCNFLDKNVKDNKNYQYTVVAHKGNYRSSFSYKTSKIYIIAPILKNVKNYNGYVKVSWEKTKTADKYKVYRKTAKSEWALLDTVSKNVSSFKDNTVKNGSKYFYTVRAVDGEYNSGYDRAGVEAKYVSAPGSVTLKNYYSNSIKIQWDKVKNAKSYIVYRKDTKNKNWVKVSETADCQYKDTNVADGIKYTYAVKVKGQNGGISGYSKNASITALKCPTGIKVSCTSAGVKISWTKISSATGYRVYRKTKGSSEWKVIKKIDSASTTKYTDIEAKDGVTYTYRVIQMNGSEKGSYHKDGFTIKVLNAPMLSAEHSPKGIVLKWSKTKIGTGYQVQRKAQGEKDWKTLTTLTSTDTLTYRDSKPVYGKENKYRIVVRDAKLVSDTISLYGINPKKKMVALTYDDGPYTPVTNQILDVLEENNARATFFVVGSRVSTYKNCIKREAKLGCEIGNHTYNHTILTSVSAKKIKSEISKTNKAVKSITGQTPEIVRTPGGAVNSTVKANVDYPMFNWSVDTLDWKNRNSSSVISSVKNNVRDGSIILMHDLYGSTGDATEVIVPWLVKKGYQLVTVSELMAVKGIEVEEGQLYTRAY